MRTFTILGAILSSTALFACGDGDGQGNGDGNVALSADESTSLQYMREEEKLARDVYRALGDADPMFANIEDSEQTHMNAVLTLIERYDMEDPAAGNADGDFGNPTLQMLYDDLVQAGSASRLAAVQVGVEIEELDLHDLDEALATVAHNDVANTYDNLARGSRNHLRAFYGKVVALGGEYTPKHLPESEFQNIVSSPVETGGPSK